MADSKNFSLSDQETPENPKKRNTVPSQSLTQSDADRFFDLDTPAKDPTVLALSRRGEIAVILFNKTGKKCVELYSADGKCLRDIGTQGTGEGRLTSPWGIVFTDDDRLLVSDNQDDRASLKKYHIDGRFLGIIHNQNGMIFGRMCSSGQTIACLSFNTKSNETSIMLFSKETLKYLKDISLRFDVKGERPEYVTHGNNKYFVSFQNRHCTYVFDESGNMLNTIGKEGEKPGHLKNPQGLAVFGGDMLLVCDAGNRRVQLFSQKGCCINTIDCCGSSLAQLEWPIDVAVTQSDVLVLEGDNRRIRMFKITHLKE